MQPARFKDREVPMITNLIKLFCAALAFGASSTAVALAVAVTGLWLIGVATGDQPSITKIAFFETPTSASGH
jgi:hypothetical protein